MSSIKQSVWPMCLQNSWIGATKKVSRGCLESIMSQATDLFQGFPLPFAIHQECWNLDKCLSWNYRCQLYPSTDLSSIKRKERIKTSLLPQFLQKEKKAIQPAPHKTSKPDHCTNYIHFPATLNQIQLEVQRTSVTVCDGSEALFVVHTYIYVMYKTRTSHLWNFI